MFNEDYITDVNESENAVMEIKAENDERVNHFKGKVQDITLDAMTGEVIESREWDSNVVVNDCSKLIACLIKNEAGMSGAMKWAVGKGKTDWSNETPPLPKETDSKLVDETYRKDIPSNSIKFIDSLGVESNTPTNTIEITITFDETEANGELREFGIVGGNATELKDSGIFINHKIHPLIYKTNQMLLKRVLRLTF